MAMLVCFLDRDGHERLEYFQSAETDGIYYMVNGYFVSQETYDEIKTAVMAEIVQQERKVADA